MKIKKGDTVKIISGNDSGKTGEVLRVFPDKNKLLVKGINIAKKHLKASKTSPHGGIIDKTLPINATNAMLICPGCAKPTRIKYSIKENSKLRVCAKCKKTI
jgi:large subunit ribosomal protein L24